MKKHLLTFLILLVTISFAFSQGATLPYYTGFDSPSELAGWQEFRTGYLSSYSWGAGGGGFSGNCISHDYNVGGDPADTVVDWYVSPPLNITAASKIALKIHTSGFSTPFPDNCEVYFGTGSKDPSVGNFVLIGNVSYMLPQFTWLDTTFNISSISDSGYIAIRYKTIGAAWSVYRIDNITVSLDSTVAINENENTGKNSFSLFPNPFNNTTTISLNQKLVSSPLELRMYDIFGREVKRLSDINTKDVQINRENLVNGIYFIGLIQDENLVNCRKIIIR